MITLKFSKDRVGFEHPAQGPNHCGDCKHFLGGRCAIVYGTVLAQDWCERFEAMKPKQENPCGYSDTFGATATPNPQKYVKEHDTVKSRIGGKPREISFGPLPGGLVPSNPFASLLQARFLHAHPEKVGGEKKLEEWDKSTNFKHIPKKVK